MALPAPQSRPHDDTKMHPRTMGELMAFAQAANDLESLVETFAAMIAELGFGAHFCVEIDAGGRAQPLFGDADRLPDWPDMRRPTRSSDLALEVQNWHGRPTWLCLDGRDVTLDTATRARLQGWAEVYASYAMALFERERDIPTSTGLGLAQRQCLAQLLLGRREHDIAAMLDITPLAVHGHVDAAIALLGVGTRAEAVSLAARRGWLAGLEWYAPTVQGSASAFRG